ncbi:MAG: hypothetical protein E7L00_06385 [Propionibacteriaceae bacterium]|nr:hypothetical protein [Propionibacteriaceae bacterium]
MPETRTFDPSEGDDLAKLVRDAIGERVRPNEPGSKPDAPAEEEEQADDGTASVTDLPDLSF